MDCRDKPTAVRLSEQREFCFASWLVLILFRHYRAAATAARPGNPSVAAAFSAANLDRRVFARR
jgi:hypothetical protein